MSEDQWFKLEKFFYYTYMTIVFSFVAVVLYFSYYYLKANYKEIIRNQFLNNNSKQVSYSNGREIEDFSYDPEEDKKFEKPLPGFVLDNINNDELEKLKP